MQKYKFLTVKANFYIKTCSFSFTGFPDMNIQA